MKAFIVVQRGLAYNDEYYRRHESKDEIEIGFINHTDAQKQADMLNGQYLRENSEVVDYHGQPFMLYEVVEVEIREIT